MLAILGLTAAILIATEDPKRIETIDVNIRHKIDQRCYINETQIDLDIGWDDLDCQYEYDLATGAIEEF